MIDQKKSQEPKYLYSLQKSLTALVLIQLTGSVFLTKYELESTNSTSAQIGLKILLEILLATVPLVLSSRIGTLRFAEEEYFTEFGESEIYKILLTENILGKILGFVIFGKLESLGLTQGHIVTNFCYYLGLFTIYHNGEFFFVLWCHPKELSWKSKILNFPHV